MGTSKKLQRRDKNREARRKGRKFKQRPPLYWVDKLIYITLIALPLVLFGAELWSIAHFSSWIWAQESLIALWQPYDGLASAGLCLLLAAACLFGIGLECRQPIFGIPGFEYGRAGRMATEDIPLFAKAPSKAAGFQKFKYGVLGGLACLLIVLSVTMVWRFEYSRWELHTDQIVHYDALNRAEEMPWSVVKSHTIGTGASGGKHSRFLVEMVLELRSGETLEMERSNFRSLDDFLQTDQRLTKQGRRRQLRVNPWQWKQIEKREAYPSEELEILWQILEFSAS